MIISPGNRLILIEAGDGHPYRRQHFRAGGLLPQPNLGAVDCVDEILAGEFVRG
jgi:hypothetical protein